VTKEVSDADRKRISQIEEEEIKLKQEISKLKVNPHIYSKPPKNERKISNHKF
jgi:hypothetical protein